MNQDSGGLSVRLTNRSVTDDTGPVQGAYPWPAHLCADHGASRAVLTHAGGLPFRGVIFADANTARGKLCDFGAITGRNDLLRVGKAEAV